MSNATSTSEKFGFNLFSLEGKTALITGSAQGIGLTLARGLASVGANVILNGRNEEKLQQAKSTLAAENVDCDTMTFDVTDQPAVAEAINRYEADKAPIDIVVNNAGIQHRGPLHEFDPAMFDKIMQTNVSSLFYVAQAAARHMIPRGKGKIINIASVQSQLARPGIAPYTASKGAVSNLTKGMATDWAQFGLQINAIAPGYFATKMNEALVNDPDFTGWLKKRTPAGRWGEVEELVGACIFLASPSSSFVNGITLFVDGGMTSSV